MRTKYITVEIQEEEDVCVQLVRMTPDEYVACEKAFYMEWTKVSNVGTGADTMEEYIEGIKKSPMLFFDKEYKELVQNTLKYERMNKAINSNVEKALS